MHIVKPEYDITKPESDIAKPESYDGEGAKINESAV